MSKVSALAKLIRAMSGRPKFLRLHTAGGEFVLVAEPNLSTRGSQDAIERWLRKRVRDSRIAQHSIQRFTGFVPALEGDKLEPAIRQVARQLAIGRMVALRLDHNLPVLDGPHVVDLADLAREPLEPEPVQARVRPAALPTPTPPASDGVPEPAPRPEVETRTLHVAETEDGCFGLERAVLLPDLGPPSDGPHLVVRTALDVIAGALTHAAKNPEDRLLVAGHTDARGSAAFNEALALARATSVQLYLSGDHPRWASHCIEHAADDDVQRVLSWVARTHEGFDCDPGPIDGDFGPASQTALDAFRQAFDPAIPAGGPVSVQDWQAFATMYDRDLCRVLDLSPEALTQARQALAFFDPPAVGFGEAHARHTSKSSDAARATDRRVDLVFFDPDELPTGAGPALGEEVYGESTLYQHRPIAAPKTVLRPSDLYIEVVDDDGRPIPNIALALDTGSSAGLEAHLDDLGRAELADLAPGSRDVFLSSFDVQTRRATDGSS